MKKNLLLISILMVCALSLVITNTYGLFETKGKANLSLSIGKWKVVLNDTDITLKQDIAFSDFVFTGSEHIEEGYFAAGSTGTFEVEIDFSNCDTSVEYDLLFDTTQFENHPNIELVLTDEDTNEISTDERFHGVVRLTDSSRIKRFKIQLIWNDIEEYNENDNELIGKSINLLVDSNFNQYTGE